MSHHENGTYHSGEPGTHQENPQPYSSHMVRVASKLKSQQKCKFQGQVQTEKELCRGSYDKNIDSDLFSKHMKLTD